MLNALTSKLDEPGKPELATFTASDGYPFFYRRFPSEGPPRGRVVFIHGIQSHGTWYARSCARLAAAGYEVFFIDRRGCGQNMKNRGDMPGFRRALDDLAEFIRALPNNGLPVFLAAISWGGKLGLALPYRHPGLVKGLMLLCPGIVPKVRPSFLTRARIALARVFRPSKFFPIPLNDPRLFTSSADWQRFVEMDQLGLRYATARMLFGSFALDIYLKRAAKGATLPILLLLAEHDAIIQNVGVRAHVDKLPTIDKQVIEYAGAHHTLEFEAEGHPFVDDMIGWLKGRS